MTLACRDGVVAAPWGVARCGSDTIERLRAFCLSRGLGAVAERIGGLGAELDGDLEGVGLALEALPRGARLVDRAAAHLFERAGKRLRPLCVALAARSGGGFGPAAGELAVAAELVHGATLLHDDVVDLGSVRRGAPTARAVYGNAASIFAGDWMMVEAFRRVARAGVPGVLERLIEVIHEMIAAESLQLEQRGRISADRVQYFQVVEGKTAALFRWAMFAGARAGGLGQGECAALEAYGAHLGVAFQIVDDLLDLAGSEAVAGKSLYGDLREGKRTFPLLLALERAPEIAAPLQELAALQADVPVPPGLITRVVELLEATGSLRDARVMAAEEAKRATCALAVLPDSAARAALELVALCAVERDR